MTLRELAIVLKERQIHPESLTVFNFTDKDPHTRKKVTAVEREAGKHLVDNTIKYLLGAADFKGIKVENPPDPIKFIDTANLSYDHELMKHIDDTVWLTDKAGRVLGEKVKALGGHVFHVRDILTRAGVWNLSADIPDQIWFAMVMIADPDKTIDFWITEMGNAFDQGEPSNMSGEEYVKALTRYRDSASKMTTNQKIQAIKLLFTDFTTPLLPALQKGGRASWVHRMKTFRNYLPSDWKKQVWVPPVSIGRLARH